jgi:hypothetical protein
LACFLSESELVIPRIDGKQIAIKNERKTMHLLLFSPVLAFADPGVGNSAALFIMVQFAIAVFAKGSGKS